MHLKTSRTTAVTAVPQRAVVVNTERARAALIPISKTMHAKLRSVMAADN
jgi:hypothetical protein